jgi:hypothetical protein
MLLPGEYRPALKYPMFWIVITLSGLLGLAISFTSMWFLHQTSPTTHRLVSLLYHVSSFALSSVKIVSEHCFNKIRRFIWLYLRDLCAHSIFFLWANFVELVIRVVEKWLWHATWVCQKIVWVHFSLQLFNQSVCDLCISWVSSGTKNSGCLLSVATVRVQYKHLSRMILIG